MYYKIIILMQFRWQTLERCSNQARNGKKVQKDHSLTVLSMFDLFLVVLSLLQ